MNLQTTDGRVIPGGPLVGPKGDVLDRPGLQLRVSDTSVSVVPAPSATPSPAVAPPVVPSAPVPSRRRRARPCPSRQR